MLRCQPSQITLQPSEVAYWEKSGTKVRGWQQYPAAKKGVQIKTGPRRSTQFEMIPEDDEEDCRKEGSCSFESNLGYNLDELSLRRSVVVTDVDSPMISDSTVETFQIEQETQPVFVPKDNSKTTVEQNDALGIDAAALNSRLVPGHTRHVPSMHLQRNGVSDLDGTSEDGLILPYDEIPAATVAGTLLSHSSNPPNRYSGDHATRYTSLEQRPGVSPLTTSIQGVQPANQEESQRRDDWDYLQPGLLSEHSTSRPLSSIDGNETMTSSPTNRRDTAAFAQSHAVEESLWMRNSPLDELTRCLDRIIASQATSSDRQESSNSPKRYDFHLLSGDPFGYDPECAKTTAHEEFVRMLDTHVENIDVCEYQEATQSLPDRSSAQSYSIRGCASTVEDSSQARTQDSNRSYSYRHRPHAFHQRTPRAVPATGHASDESLHFTTPSIPIYDDSLPPEIQPQTPADIQPSLRRERRRAHTISSSYQHRTRSEDKTIYSSENDLSVDFRQAERDHIVWARRQAGGSLELTPPRQGRFEQYFHS